MVEPTAAWRNLRRTTLTGLLALAAGTAPAAARHHHRGGHHGRMVFARAAARSHPAHVRPGSYGPPFSVFAVDGNSGRTLYAQDENALRHPASITKVMTLYLLFERLEKRQLSLDDRIEVSEHAASMPPTKLGLRPGATIRIEDAIKAIVTKSSNDMAVAIAERLGGDERSFAQMMTRKAHSLGMSRTNFVNASGLPDDMQLTTAHDLVVLGRAIHDRYPHYFHFFSTPSFRYAGQFMQNHNHLMEQVEGMDGIKTGYTRSSGFNLLSSVSRNGHWLVSVVLGGKTRLGRDRIMADLIASQIDKCAVTRTAAAIVENPALEHVAEAIPVVEHEGQAAPPVETLDDEAAESMPAQRGRPAAVAGEEGAPAGSEAKSETQSADAALASESAEGEETSANGGPVEPVRARAARRATAKAEAHAASPKVATAEIVQPRPRPAFVSGLPRSGDRDLMSTASIPNHRDGSTMPYKGAATATPSTIRHVGRPARPVPVADAKAPEAASTRPSGPGWMIQVGATPTLAQANDLLARARQQSAGSLAAARPFTEQVQKGKETLFRARFAGLEAASADAACRHLKRAGVSCFASKN